MWGSGPGGDAVGPALRLGGREMAREEVLTTGTNRPVQTQRTAKGWTPSRREQFLDHVAATCNVRAATEAVGLSQASVYALRRRDAAFAAQWRMALLAGYDRLEEMLVSKAIAVLEGVAVGDPDKVVCGAISVEQAIKLLDRHRSVVTRPPTQYPRWVAGWGSGPAPPAINAACCRPASCGRTGRRRRGSVSL